MVVAVALGATTFFGSNGPLKPPRAPLAQPPRPEPPGQIPTLPPSANGPGPRANPPTVITGPSNPEQPPVYAAGEIVSIPLSFTVKNENASKVPCPTDGRAYTIRGQLVGPSAVIAASPRSATMYLHAITAGQWEWSLRSVPGYDYATELALRGHTSVILDRLGAGTSDNPNGNRICLGSEADVAHQIAQQLRAGSYALDGHSGLAFDRLVLAGHSAAGLIVEIASSSFDDWDAVMVMQWADVPDVRLVPVLADIARTAILECAFGGLSAEKDGSGPKGYTNTWADESVFRQIFHNVDPAVFRDIVGRLSRDPCGLYYSVGQALAVNNTLLQTIAKPVLLMIGDHDLFTTQSAEIHASRFLSSPDVTLKIIPNSGHVAVLERNAPLFRTMVSEWLAARGF